MKPKSASDLILKFEQDLHVQDNYFSRLQIVSSKSSDTFKNYFYIDLIICKNPALYNTCTYTQ